MCIWKPCGTFQFAYIHVYRYPHHSILCYIRFIPTNKHTCTHAFNFQHIKWQKTWLCSAILLPFTICHSVRPRNDKNSHPRAKCAIMPLSLSLTLSVCYIQPVFILILLPFIHSFRPFDRLYTPSTCLLARLRTAREKKWGKKFNIVFMLSNTQSECERSRACYMVVGVLE